MPTYDLSHPLETGMPGYPGTEPVEIEPTATVVDEGYRTTRLWIDSHTGTHVDAPAHMLPDGRALGSYPPETFRFAARLVDARPLEARQPIDEDVLRAASGALRDVDLVVVRTGWDAHWETDRYVDHPYLTAGAAEFLVDRNCHLGVDALNVDPTPSPAAEADEPDGFPVHRVLFADERLILENLRGLERLPVDESFEIHAYPLAIADVDASPVRAVAVV